jgi:hypothetical protein
MSNMANPFLSLTPCDTETALLLEQAIVHDIGNAVAYTDGERVFLNTDDNLFNILPAYDPILMKKWLLWHERYHKELRHHNRFFKYLSEIKDAEAEDKFHLSKAEVNIIMDILVHDSLSKMFPELVETAINNLAQMRNRNSLSYTFETFTLEEMLDEYSKFKQGDSKDEGGDSKDEEDKEEDTEDTPDGDSEGDSKPKDKKDSEPKPEDKKDKKDKSHEDRHKSTPEEGTPEKEKGDKPEPEHDKTDWSQLEQLDDKEFITEEEGDSYTREIARLRAMRIKLANITKTLNGLVTSTRKRTYARPSSIKVGGGVMLKGSLPGKASLYLVFDASGSMGSELKTFKDIIEQAVPQAMNTPTEWFAGYGARIEPYEKNWQGNYYKGKFRDIVPIRADDGFSDDGDRTIELCLKAEQKGYSPIGVTDGGGGIYWTEDQIKQLKRTILVGHNKNWLEDVQKINPRIQILCV